jgi:tetratricopeptide (TPR) repeat protein
MAKLTKEQTLGLICFALAIGTFLLYWPVSHNTFTNFDDDGYITGNTHVRDGLSWSGILWAFKSGYAANWHPLTWISHMIDCQLFGVNHPGAHHLVNVLFHAANTLLLFALLNYLTGALWRSAFVAALFAWHPMHVESVAWAAERKDVLSAFFWMLTLLAYARFVKGPKPGSSVWEFASSPAYWLALFLFACGLMSKPMVVTLPFVLLLLDFWPLQRFNPAAFKRLIVEKIPFFLMAFAGSVVTFLVQKTGGAVSGDPLSFRVLNALWAYQRYIAKLFWPTNLAIVYPFQTHGLLALGIIASLLLVICSMAFIVLSAKRPYFFTGWFWFLGTLVPTIGVIEVGSASMADRYSYLPSIGLFILVTWGLSDFFESRGRQNSLVPLAVLALGVCLVLSSIQISYWRNSITLFSHAVAVTTDNYVADACLGQALDAAGDESDALKYCSEAVRIDPDYPPGQFFLGTVYWKEGDTKDAFDSLDAAVKAAPHDSGFQYNVGKFLLEHGSPDKAIPCFNAVLEDKDSPYLAEARNALGKTYLKQGKLTDAAEQLSQAIELEPENAQNHYDLGTILFQMSQLDAAIAQFEVAIKLNSDFALAEENLAVALAGEGRTADAITHFSRVVELEPNDPDARFNLGLACLNNHQPSEAAAQFSIEIELAPNETKAHYRLAQAMEQQNELPEAVAQYRQALQLRPDFPEAKNELNAILAAHPNLR